MKTKLTIEVNPKRFLEMHLHNKDGTYVAIEKKNKNSSSLVFADT